MAIKKECFLQGLVHSINLINISLLYLEPRVESISFEKYCSTKALWYYK